MCLNFVPNTQMLLVGVANNVYCVHADVVSMAMNHITRPICYHNSTNIPLCGAQYGAQAFISSTIQWRTPFDEIGFGIAMT